MCDVLTEDHNPTGRSRIVFVVIHHNVKAIKQAHTKIKTTNNHQYNRTNAFRQTNKPLPSSIDTDVCDMLAGQRRREEVPFLTAMTN